MELVKCTEDYWEDVRNLRNDDRVNQGFINTAYITKKMQNNYMAKYSKFYRVLLVDKNFAGYVGVIDDDIRVCTHPNFQGQGCGKFMIENIMTEFPNAIAKVKVDNIASMKLFKSLGFTEKYIILGRKE